MNQILRCDWLSERARWNCLASSGLPAVCRKKTFPESQDGWILAKFFFCELMDLDSVSFHELAKKEFDQYPAILTSHLANNSYLKYLNISGTERDIWKWQPVGKM